MARSSSPRGRGPRRKAGRPVVRLVLPALAVCALVAGAGLLMASRSAAAPVEQNSGHAGVIDFTTYYPATVQRVSYTYRGRKLTLGAPALVAQLPGADGIAYTASGDLIVGGQAPGRLFVIPPSGGPITSVHSGTTGSFLVAIGPSGDELFTAGLPGALAKVPLNPIGDGHPIPLTGDDSNITDLAFGPNGQVVYTSSDSDGRGNIGLLDLTTGFTHRLLSDTVGAHGVMFDRYTSSYFVIGGDSILQLPSSDPSEVISELTVPGMQFDQGAVTGEGIAFMASNTGYLVMIDYSSTGRIGDTADVARTVFLAKHLDDVAPLAGPGARPAPRPTSGLRRAGESSLAAGAFLGVLAVMGAARGSRRRGTSRKSRKRLPRWDKRRGSPESTNWVSGPIDDFDPFV